MCGEAAELGVMCLDLDDAGIGDKTLDSVLDLVACGKISVGQEVVVEGSQRDLPEMHNLRHLTDTVVSSFGALAHEDRGARVVRVVGGLVGLVHEDQFLAGFGIAQLEAIGRPRPLVGDVAFCTVQSKPSIRQAEEVTERLGRRPVMRKDMWGSWVRLVDDAIGSHRRLRFYPFLVSNSRSGAAPVAAYEIHWAYWL